jgi:hypothetical protein
MSRAATLHCPCLSRLTATTVSLEQSPAVCSMSDATCRYPSGSSDSTGRCHSMFHGLRHTFASLMSTHPGAAPKAVSKAIVRASVAFTMNTYSHILPGMQSEGSRLPNEVLPAGISGGRQFTPIQHQE